MTAGTTTANGVLVRAPAGRRELPEVSEPSATEIERWLTAGPRYGLTVVGPPLPPEA